MDKILSCRLLPVVITAVRDTVQTNHGRQPVMLSVPDRKKGKPMRTDAAQPLAKETLSSHYTQPNTAGSCTLLEPSTDRLGGFRLGGFRPKPQQQACTGKMHTMPSPHHHHHLRQHLHPGLPPAWPGDGPTGPYQCNAAVMQNSSRALPESLIH